MLEVENLHAYYGKSHILHGVHLRVGKGEIVSLLGRNGVGRSTTVKAIMGQVEAEGSVRFKNEQMLGLKAYQIAHKGLGYVPEMRDIFPTLTVEQNLILGMKGAKPDKSARWNIDDMYRLFPRLQERARVEAGMISGGEQQMLTLCRTLMGDPDLIMIDEPTEGLAPKLVEQVAHLLETIARRGVSILLVEQNVQLSLETAHYGFVIEQGRIVNEGTSADLLGDSRVKDAYLSF